MTTSTLFDTTAHRLSMHDSIHMTSSTLQAYRERFDRWAIAWSGGKDSTAAVTLIAWLIESGQIEAPRELRVLYADTRMELPPLAISAQSVMADLRERGIHVEVVCAPMEKRYLPYILGRGVPPPNNNTLRWCTRQIKMEPMRAAIEALNQPYTMPGATSPLPSGEGPGVGSGFLTITGVRIGESAARDERIVLSCSKDGAECGQGHFFQGLNNTLAPLVHWRVCHVWEWLKHWAPQAQFGDWDTTLLADAYGGDEAEEINARTGCICCPLASKDTALDAILAMPRWAYLAPLRRLRDIYEEMRSPIHRLRQHGEKKKDGALAANPNRMGPLTIEARKEFFSRITQIQIEINFEAIRLGRPTIDILNPQEIRFIGQCWQQNLYPNGWTGDEPSAALPYDEIYSDGSVQPLLFYDQCL